MDYEEYRSRYFEQPEPAPRSALRGLGGAALTFRDFDRAVDFYTRVFGPPPYVEGRGTRGWRIGTGWLTLLAGDGPGEHAPALPAGAGVVNVEIQIEAETVREAERLHARFLEAGGEGRAPSDELMYRPIRSCPVRDPFGTEILITAPLPGEGEVPVPDAPVSLREITDGTVRAILQLRVTEWQRRFVADNGTSLAQAHFSPHAWFRAIYAGEVPVGFLMTHEDREKPEYYLWRFMIDHRYQGAGYGRRALELLIERIGGLPGATAFYTSVVEDEGGPRGFYESLGFVATGTIDGGEHVLRLDLPPAEGR